MKPSDSTLVPSVSQAQGMEDMAEHATLSGGFCPLLSVVPLLSLAQVCPQPVVGETCNALGFWFIDFRKYRENLNSHT